MGAPIALAMGMLAATPAAHDSQYLFTWAMETRDLVATPQASATGRDFLAVFDIGPDSKEFGRLVTALPVGDHAQMAHHTNHEMPADGLLFASDYMAGEGFVFDLNQPHKPKLVATFGDAGPYTHPHSFERLPDGHTLATYQFKGKPDEQAGALVELDRKGHVVRASDASDPDVDPFIRPYSLLALPKLDRVITTSADMLPSDHASHVVQVWRLSDLKLLKSVLLPKAPHYKDVVSKGATEARLLEDGATVLVVTGNCGLYKLGDLAGSEPSVQFVYDFGYRACALPTVVGHYWVQATMSGHSLTSLDVRDPEHPVEAGHLILEDAALPHWLAHEPGGNRIVITGFGRLATHMLFATINPQTGELKLEPHQIDFDRQWPDGWNGPAMPHGSVFSK
jgi:hypothetical protein